MKIIHIITSISRGGRERQLATMVANMDLNKYYPMIIYFNSSSHSYIDEYELDKYVNKIKSKFIISRLMEVNKLLKQSKPDIVHTWGNLESIIALCLKPFHSYKVINGSVRHGIRSKKMWHYFRTLVLHLSGNVLSNSYAGLRANNLKRGYVLYNGLEDRLIGKLSAAQKVKERKRIIGNNNKTIMISVANFVPYKDYHSILRALKRIKEDGYLFLYIILGDGLLKEEIECKIAEYDLLQHVLMPGHVTNVIEYLRISDIFIHSSKGEGCSNAVLEAMAAGLPVIASNTGGTEEIVSSENGFLFEYKDTDQIYEYLIRCLNDTDKRNKMGEASYRIIKNKFTVGTMIRNYENILSGLQ